MFNSKPKCAIINAVCPANGNPERGRYCPHWDHHIEETHVDTGETRQREGCDIPAMRAWTKDTQQAGWISARFVNLMSNAIVKLDNATAQRVEQLTIKTQALQEVQNAHGQVLIGAVEKDDAA